MQQAWDIDKALFDFDEEIDKLSDVSDRYQDLFIKPESNTQTAPLTQELVQQSNESKEQPIKPSVPKS